MATMAYGYVSVDRSNQFLLPPDVRDWLPPSHLAWFVIDVVERLDTSALHARHRNDGVGRRAYDPDMLLALVIYAYCTGERSSRQIERRCELDVAYRVIAANHAPDHTTIARFRQDHDAHARRLFVDVLELCATAGLASVGVVAVDGTKMAADASMKAIRNRADLEREVATLFDDAKAKDDDEDRRFGAGRGDELPDDLADPSRRRARLDAALAVLEARAAARRDTEQAAQAARRQVAASAHTPGFPHGRIPSSAEGVAEAEARLAARLAADRARFEAWQERRRQAQAAGRRGVTGRRPGESDQTKRARTALANVVAAAARAERREAKDDKVNLTDPDSRLVKTTSGIVWGYNAQAAVNTSGIVLAAELTQQANDQRQLIPMVAATQANLATVGVTEPIGVMLFDGGYLSEDNLTTPGPDRLVATTKSHKLRRAAKKDGFATGDPPPGASPIEAMEHRLRTEEGMALYTLRQHTVEPVFGTIKAARGFRRFTRRGYVAARAEWQLITATHNIAKLHRSGFVIV